jgi:hypothetical protein
MFDGEVVAWTPDLSYLTFLSKEDRKLIALPNKIKNENKQRKRIRI